MPLNLLIVHGDVPPPDRDACSLRIFRICGLLADAGHRLTFLARGGLSQERNVQLLLDMGVQEVIPVDPERLLAHHRRTDVRLPFPLLDVPGLLDRGRFDVAWLSLYDVAEQYLPLIREYSPATRVVVDSTDVHWVREHRGAVLNDNPVALAAALRTRERERLVYASADALVAVSDVEAEAMRDLASEVPVGVVSIVHPVSDTMTTPAGRSGVLFVGNFNHAPNVDAAVDFVASVWPLVRDALPGVQLTLLGTDPPLAVQMLAGADVAVTGWVPEVEPYLEQARVAIAPLRWGAGVKGKIGEAMAEGVPVVTTSIGAEGMGLVDGEQALVADAPDAFAAAVVRLHRDDDLWLGLVRAAKLHVAERLGPAAAWAGIESVLTTVAAPRWQVAVDAPWFDDALADYAREYSAADPATLVVTVPAGDPQAPAVAYERVVEIAGRIGLDFAAMADVEITPWDARLPLPARTVVLDRPHRSVD